ncbi:uncharacterized protein H6S33_005560 [Morchella sextelata]|uniref:uncharacterized protein n=1 Tax=Morchella sextelata TaxID=1174677 RepID=UPI001D05BB5B|nr:uncharacterized protein H6S33_005560 [Morchella sextelata]KAH0613674.1 hypothetical protein H6S33_005560 [Morchella sextelata]
MHAYIPQPFHTPPPPPPPPPPYPTPPPPPPPPPHHKPGFGAIWPVDSIPPGTAGPGIKWMFRDGMGGGSWWWYRVVVELAIDGDGSHVRPLRLSVFKS